MKNMRKRGTQILLAAALVMMTIFGISTMVQAAAKPQLPTDSLYLTYIKAEAAQKRVSAITVQDLPKNGKITRVVSGNKKVVAAKPFKTVKKDGSYLSLSFYNEKTGAHQDLFVGFKN